MKLWDDTNFLNLQSSANSISVISVEGEWENAPSCHGRRSSLDSITELPHALPTASLDADHIQMLARGGAHEFCGPQFSERTILSLLCMLVKIRFIQMSLGS